MRESLELAKKELQRADHLLYVSLKYTRTVDVIKNIISRLIDAMDFGMTALLEIAMEQGKIDAIPTTPIEKTNAAKTVLEQTSPLIHYLDFFLLLRKINKAEFERSQEYRRHVTMTAHLDSEDIEITIDIIGDYFAHVKEFLQSIDTLEQ